MDHEPEFDADYLDQFSRLPSDLQRQIIRLTRAPAKNPTVSKRDREAAEARAKQLEAIRRKK